jgi:hypothetical protein
MSKAASSHWPLDLTTPPATVHVHGFSRRAGEIICFSWLRGAPRVSSVGARSPQARPLRGCAAWPSAERLIESRGAILYDRVRAYPRGTKSLGMKWKRSGDRHCVRSRRGRSSRAVHHRIRIRCRVAQECRIKRADFSSAPFSRLQDLQVAAPAETLLSSVLAVGLSLHSDP